MISTPGVMGPGISRITHVEVDLRRPAIWAAGAILCAGLALPGPAASAITVPPDIAPHGRATDCTGEATLAAARPSTGLALRPLSSGEAEGALGVPGPSANG